MSDMSSVQQNGNTSVTQSNGHKSSNPSRTKVAIPLSLSKPRKAQAGIDEKKDKQENSQKENREELARRDNDESSTSTPSVSDQNITTPSQASSTSDLAADSSITKPPNTTASPRRPAQIRTQLPPAFVPSRSPHVQDASSPNGPLRQFQNGAPMIYDEHTPNGTYSHHSRRNTQSHHSSFSHSHHISDSNVHPLSPNGWNLQRPYHPNQYPNRYPPRDNYHPMHTPNGSMSFRPDSPHSNDSTKHDQRFQAPFSPSYLQPHPSDRATSENTLSLAQHTSSLFGRGDFTDIRLNISLQSNGTSASIDAHKILLVRSSKLAELISIQHESAIEIHLSGPWHSLNAYIDAIAWLYGISKLDVARVEGREAQLRHALAYIAASQDLRLPLLAQRGFELAITLLSWETLPLLLSFALEGGLHEAWSRQDGNMSTTKPTNDPAATQLLHATISFMISAFPPNFYPDTSAPQIHLMQQSAITNGHGESKPSVAHRSSRSVNDPRLSRIRFGEIGGANGSEDNRPPPLASTVSSLLFSLPFPILKAFLEHPALSDRLGVETVGSIIRQVIVEREARRTKALADMNPGSVVSGELHFEELVVGDSRSPLALALSRRWVSPPPT